MDELKTSLVTFLGNEGKKHRPELGDSVGNYDDCYYDGYEAAMHDLRLMLSHLGIVEPPVTPPET